MNNHERKLYMKEWFQEARYGGTEKSRKEKLVALTFDDGPDREISPEVLNILNENGIKSTFFWIVENAIILREKQPELFKSILSKINEGGHEIGLHAPDNTRPSLRSRFFGHFSRNDFASAKETLESITERPIEYFRPHYYQLGSSIAHASELGMTTILGNPFRAVRPDGPSFYQISTLSTSTPGSIMILHDGQHGIKGKNRILDVLPKSISNLKNKGLKLTSVSNILEN